MSPRGFRNRRWLESQGSHTDSFFAIADLLIIGREDFFDLFCVLQFGHGYFVRHRFSFDALSAFEKLPDE